MSYERITVRNASPTIGGYAEGCDLGDLDDETFTEILDAFHDRGVLFFRDQDIDAEGQLAFARRFGTPEIYPFKEGNPTFSPSPAGDEVVRLIHDAERPGYENEWHTDVPWMVEPSMGSILRALEVPPSGGGDTLFSDCRAVYDSLDPSTQESLADLTVRYDWLNAFGTALPPAALAAFREQHPGAEHPLVRTHPATGRKAIYLSHIFFLSIGGVHPMHGRQILDHLTGLIARPEFQCRLTWEVGTVAVWDNRCVQHYAVNDYFPERRVMERITIAGDKPF